MLRVWIDCIEYKTEEGVVDTTDIEEMNHVVLGLFCIVLYLQMKNQQPKLMESINRQLQPFPVLFRIMPFFGLLTQFAFWICSFTLNSFQVTSMHATTFEHRPNPPVSAVWAAQQEVVGDVFADHLLSKKHMLLLGNKSTHSSATSLRQSVCVFLPFIFVSFPRK